MPQIKDTKPQWKMTTAIVCLIGTVVLMAAIVIVMSTVAYNQRINAAEKGILLKAYTREMEWGLGQIIAPFSWAPLLMELGAAVVGMLPSRQQDSGPEGPGDGYGMCKGPCCRQELLTRNE